MKNNNSIDLRVNAFSRELAIALRRISDRQAENVPENLPKPKLKENKSRVAK